MHAKVRHVATAVVVAVSLTPLAPALTAWLAVAVAVHAAMAVAAVAEDLVAEVVVAAAAAVAAAMAAAMVAVVRSAADQTAISNWHVGDRQCADHRTSCPGCEAHGAWLPCPAFWRATF